MIPALVLTGGLATRLYPLSLVRAKAALPVAGTPLVVRILEWLRQAEIADVVLNLHHLPHTLTRLLGDGAELGIRVRYSWEVPLLGSAGGPKRALPLLLNGSGAELHDRRTILIVNGDTLTNADIVPAIEQHRSTGALVTMMVVPNREPEKYSGLLVDESGFVTGVSKRGESRPSFHYFGVQIVDAEALARVPPGVPYESVGALYPSLTAERPGSVRAFHCEADYLDIGTPADYLRSSKLVAAREGRGSLVGVRTGVAPTAHIDGSILWDDVMIEDGATVHECIVTDGVRVPAGTSWDRVTLRIAVGELAPGERRVGSLAIAPL